MEDSQAFARRLEEKLDAKRDRLDRVELPKLKSCFRLFQTAFQGIVGVLSNKGILHEDPYKFELKISEVTVPAETNFAEGEKIDQMSVRLSQFDSYLDFLNNYYQFSTDFLGMGRIKRLLALVKYYNFTQFAETSNQINTRCLAELVGQVRKGSDQISVGILNESLAQLDKSSREILACLKELAAYHRERYKLELRDLVIPGIKLEDDYVSAHREEALRIFKKKFAEVAGERPFFAELAEEILLEDFTNEGQGLRDSVIKRLEVEEEKKVETAKVRSYKAVILDGIRVLAGVNFTLENAVEKLSSNSAVLEMKKQSFLAKFVVMIRKIFSPGESGIRYDIEILDPISGASTEEALDFGVFIEESSRKARALAGLLQKNGPSWKRLETAPEEQAFKFLEKTMEELQHLVRRLNALEEFFKSTVDAEDKNKIRSVKAEVTAIKGALIKANQKKHEYVAQQEEKEQMRRLGISSE